MVVLRTETFVHIARMRLKIAMNNRLAAIVMIAGVLIQIFLLRRLYGTLYASRTVSSFPLRSLLVYLALSNIQIWILQTPVAREFHYQVRQGLVTFDVTRPIGFVSQMVARQVGMTVAQAAFMAPAIAVLLALGWLAGPQDVAALGEYALSLFFAFGITFGVMLIVGLVAFWTTEVESLNLLVMLVGQFLAGALVPVSLFPPVLRRITDVLPFQGTGYLPVSIYIGQLRGVVALEALALQAGWSVLLVLAAVAIWSRALHRIMSQGG
jgi:ABC-type uncharacterized transport system permease subunit